MILHEDDKTIDGIIEEANKVKRLTDLDGWKKIVLPYFEGKMSSLLQKLLDTKNHEDFLSVQGQYKFITEFLAYMNGKLEFGKAALEEREKRLRKD